MIATGVSPSGKAAGFDPAIRWFESSHPSHLNSAFFASNSNHYTIALQLGDTRA